MRERVWKEGISQVSHESGKWIYEGWSVCVCVLVTDVRGGRGDSRVEASHL